LSSRVQKSLKVAEAASKWERAAEAVAAVVLDAVVPAVLPALPVLPEDLGLRRVSIQMLPQYLQFQQHPQSRQRQAAAVDAVPMRVRLCRRSVPRERVETSSSRGILSLKRKRGAAQHNPVRPPAVEC
jgi:hypothetical protein